MRTVFSKIIMSALTGLFVMSTPVFADETKASQTIVTAATDFSRFVPRPSKATKLDYTLLDEALSYIVIDLGPSLRTRMPKPQASTGSRFVKGHVSPYRMEGTRVIFGYITDDFLAGLTDYRKDLEAIGTRIDITKLSRNEQLAYWFNLHNLTILEQIGHAYPTEEPSRIKVNVNGQKVLLDDAKILNVKGQALSLRDIREKIVYTNWSDPRNFYGFYRGDIGSPKLNRVALTASRLDFYLSQSAGEFVNSLRGFRDSNSSRYISPLYQELNGTLFKNFDADLQNHLIMYAEGEALTQVKSNKPFKFDQYQDDIADLTNGRRRASSGNALQGDLGVPREVQKFLREARDKERTLINRGLITPRGGYVIIEDVIPEDDENENP